MSAGSGPPIVLVHGINVDLELWSPVFDDLVASGHRVVAFDLRGHGESTVGSYGQNVDLMADDLKDVLEHLDLRHAIVVGHSTGGMAALTLATRHPGAAAERLAGLVLVATTAGGVFEVPRNMAQLALLKLGAGYRLVSHPRHGLVLAAEYFAPQPPLSQVRALATMWAETAEHYFDDNGLALADYDVRDRLAGVPVPSLVVVGDRDKALPPRMSQFLASRLPDARLERLEGIGHMVPWEAPEALVDMIVGFAKERRVSA